MHVGLSIAFQNPEYQRKTDLEAYQDELRLADRCEELGFGSIWTTEHHFSDSMTVPDALQFLAYMAGRTKTALLGTMVVVVPWHDPVWVVEKVAQLDNLSNGRVVLGIGQGAGGLELKGHGIPMDEARERFVEATRLICRTLESGCVEGDGPFYPHPRRELRPRPAGPFSGRTYAATVSPEAFPLMAELGIGGMYLSQTPPEAVAGNYSTYRKVFRETNGVEAPPIIYASFVFCEQDPGRARELGHRWGQAYCQSVVGTPDQCVDRIMEVREVIKSETFIGTFKCVDMPLTAANDSMELFAREVMPRLKKVKPKRSRALESVAL